MFELVSWFSGRSCFGISFNYCSYKHQFGPKRDEVTEDWRKLHNEELSDL